MSDFRDLFDDLDGYRRLPDAKHQATCHGSVTTRVTRKSA